MEGLFKRFLSGFAARLGDREARQDGSNR